MSDTLLSALDAVSRRQRDLANAEGAYYGLGPYREGDDEGSYAIPEREASGKQTLISIFLPPFGCTLSEACYVGWKHK